MLCVGLWLFVLVALVDLCCYGCVDYFVLLAIGLLEVVSCGLLWLLVCCIYFVVGGVVD